MDAEHAQARLGVVRRAARRRREASGRRSAPRPRRSGRAPARPRSGARRRGGSPPIQLVPGVNGGMAMSSRPGSTRARMRRASASGRVRGADYAARPVRTEPERGPAVRETVWERIEAARSRHDVLEPPLLHPLVRRRADRGRARRLLRPVPPRGRVDRRPLEPTSPRSCPSTPTSPATPPRSAMHVALWDGFVEARRRQHRRRRQRRDRHAASRSGESGTARSPRSRASTRSRAASPRSRRRSSRASPSTTASTRPTGTRYFTVHRGRDVEHAAEGRELLEELIQTPADEDAAVAAAERAFEANWKLLDGVSLSSRSGPPVL